MQEVAIEGIVFFSVLFGVIILGFILLIYAIVMHNILYRRLDPILFHERWFTSAELAMFSAWPLSLFKAVIYMFLISFPNYVTKRKRFKGFKQDLPVQGCLKIACKIFTYIYLLGFVFGLVLSLLVAWALVFLDS